MAARTESRRHDALRGQRADERRVSDRRAYQEGAPDDQGRSAAMGNRDFPVTDRGLTKLAGVGATADIDQAIEAGYRVSAGHGLCCGQSSQMRAARIAYKLGAKTAAVLPPIPHAVATAIRHFHWSSRPG